jgi:hypothetical protein
MGNFLRSWQEQIETFCLPENAENAGNTPGRDELPVRRWLCEGSTISGRAGARPYRPSHSMAICPTLHHSVSPSLWLRLHRMWS